VIMADPAFRYYLITDRTQCYPRSIEDAVACACEHGVKAVQLREKDLPAGPLFRLASRLRDITRHWGATLYINDRADIAMAVGADGVHCTEEGLAPDGVKHINGSLSVGASVHSIASATRAEAEGADFLLFGPVFYTQSKARYGAPQGFEALGAVVAAVGIPVYAVGGITPSGAGACMAVGASGIAGISDILGAESIVDSVNRWRHVLEEL